ncbi:MAG: NnrU family protein [Calditrichaceae bacterium]|jgi:protein-S-isoprenylcysteine O-methyltransferase Ste14
MTDYIILSFLWLLWCSIHSLLIADPVINYFRKKLNDDFRFYRLLYNLISVITLVPVLYYGYIVKGPLLFTWQGGFIIIQFIFFMIAITLFLAGAKKYDMLVFLGIRQIHSGKSRATLSEAGDIDMTGIHEIVRHPWYIGGIIFLWVINKNIYVSTFLTNFILTGYLITGAWLEEKKLIACCGDEYRNYQKRVSMLIPVKWVRAKFNL